TFGAADLPAPRIEVADDVPNIVLRRDHLDRHDGLEDLRAGLLDRFLEAGATSDFERQHRGVHVVVGTVGEDELHVDDREADHRPGPHHRFDALLDARHVFLRHVAAHHFGGEFEALAGLVWLDAEFDAGELARTARLLLVRIVVLDGAGNRFAIRHLRRADIGLDLELALHAVDDDVEVQFAHARDDGLAGFLVGLDAEARILGRKPRQRQAHLLLVGLGLRLHRDIDYRLREDHPLEDDLRVQRAQRIARRGVLEADDGDAVAGVGLVVLFPRIAVSLEHAADTLALLLDGIFHHGALLEVTRVDSAERQRPHVRVVGDLERQHGERLVVVGVALDLGAGLDVDALDRRNVDRRRQEVDDAVEQRLHALVLEGRTAEHREELRVDGTLADQPAERVLVRHFAVEIGLGRRIVHLDGGLDELFAVFDGTILEVVRNVDDVPLRAQLFIVPDKRIHLDEVDDALEAALGPDRQLHHDIVDAEALLEAVDAEVEVGADLIHLVDEDQARNDVLVRL